MCDDNLPEAGVTICLECGEPLPAEVIAALPVPRYCESCNATWLHECVYEVWKGGDDERNRRVFDS